MENKDFDQEENVEEEIFDILDLEIVKLETRLAFSDDNVDGGGGSGCCACSCSPTWNS